MIQMIPLQCEEFFQNGLITEQEMAQIIRTAAKSN